MEPLLPCCASHHRSRAAHSLIPASCHQKTPSRTDPPSDAAILLGQTPPQWITSHPTSHKPRACSQSGYCSYVPPHLSDDPSTISSSLPLTLSIFPARRNLPRQQHPSLLDPLQHPRSLLWTPAPLPTQRHPQADHRLQQNLARHAPVRPHIRDLDRARLDRPAVCRVPHPRARDLRDLPVDVCGRLAALYERVVGIREREVGEGARGAGDRGEC